MSQSRKKIMSDNSESYSPSFLISLLVHVMILGLLIIGIDFGAKPFVTQNSAKNVHVINATAVSAPPTPAPVKPAPIKPAPVEPIKPTPPKPVVPVKQEQPKPIPPVDNTAKLEHQKQLKLVAERKEKQAAQQKLEASKLALLKQREVAKQAQEAAAALQRKKLAAKKAAQAKQLAAQIKAAELQEKHAQSVQALQQQLQAEQQRLTEAATAAMQGEVDKYKALILSAISQRWLVPTGVNKQLSCELLIRLAPGGMVLDVQVAKSSGDTALDRSARAAVFKASPLPVPADAQAFDQFRQFVLKVKPESLI